MNSKTREMRRQLNPMRDEITELFGYILKVMVIVLKKRGAKVRLYRRPALFRSANGPRS
jgi:hypothetical protein